MVKTISGFMKKITVKSCANIALIKYWGKRDEDLFLPTKSSLSVTLSGLDTVTSVSINPQNRDIIYIDKKLVLDLQNNKVHKFLNLFREKFCIKSFFKIETENRFPTAAGLASSASGFAALAFALNKICDLNLSKKQLSILARQGSGSASRSIFGGFALWNKGELLDGFDCFAQQLFDQDHWPEFRVIAAIISEQKKNISSRDAMQVSVKTSPLYDDWIKGSEEKIPEMIEAIKAKDFTKVGQLAETDCLQMHKVMQTSKPEINYWKPETLQLMDKVRDLRGKSINCYFTIDAGPNVKILCLQKDIDAIICQIRECCAAKCLACSIGDDVVLQHNI